MSYNTAPRVDSGTGAPSMLWTRWVNLIAGILLFIAPWVLGYAGDPTAAWDSWILGALIAVFAFIGLLSKAVGDWSQWIVAICGVLAFISPWVLGFANIDGAFWASLILGAVAAVVAAIGILAHPGTAATV
jgi:hypothetical protein